MEEQKYSNDGRGPVPFNNASNALATYAAGMAHGLIPDNEEAKHPIAQAAPVQAAPAEAKHPTAEAKRPTADDLRGAIGVLDQLGVREKPGPQITHLVSAFADQMRALLAQKVERSIRQFTVLKLIRLLAVVICMQPRLRGWGARMCWVIASLVAAT